MWVGGDRTGSHGLAVALCGFVLNPSGTARLFWSRTNGPFVGKILDRFRTLSSCKWWESIGNRRGTSGASGYGRGVG